MRHALEAVVGFYGGRVTGVSWRRRIERYCRDHADQEYIRLVPRGVERPWICQAASHVLNKFRMKSVTGGVATVAVGQPLSESLIHRIIANGTQLPSTGKSFAGVAVRGLRPEAVLTVGPPDPFPLSVARGLGGTVFRANRSSYLSYLR